MGDWRDGSRKGGWDISMRRTERGRERMVVGGKEGQNEGRRLVY